MTERAPVPPTEIALHFADGEYQFALHLPHLAELQEKCGAGIFTIYGRVMRGRFLVEGGEVMAPPHMGEAYVNDLYETVRLGLIGGGAGMVNGQEVKVSPILAKQLVERYLHPAPLTEAWALAAAVLAAKIEGYQPPKKAAPARAPAKRRPRKTASPSPT